MGLLQSVANGVTALSDALGFERRDLKADLMLPVDNIATHFRKKKPQQTMQEAIDDYFQAFHTLLVDPGLNGMGMQLRIIETVHKES